MKNFRRKIKILIVTRRDKVALVSRFPIKWCKFTRELFDVRTNLLHFLEAIWRGKNQIVSAMKEKFFYGQSLRKIALRVLDFHSPAGRFEGTGRTFFSFAKRETKTEREKRKRILPRGRTALAILLYRRQLPLARAPLPKRRRTREGS